MITTASTPSAALRASMRPGIRPPAERASDEKTYDIALLRKLWPFARRHRALFGVAFGLIPLVTLAGLAQPVLIRNAIWAAAAERSGEAVARVAAMFGVAIAIEFVARFAQTWALQLGGQRTVADLRRATFERVLSLPLAYLDRTPVGRVTTRVTNDSDTLGELFASGAILAIADFVTLVGIVGAMLWLDTTMALVVLCVLPPLAFVVDRVRRGAREAFRSIRTAIAQLNAYVAEQVQGMLDLFKPFIHDNDPVFRTDRIRALAPHGDPDFAWDVPSIDWRAYWVDVEFPGLQTWSIPLIRGEQIPTDAPSSPPLRLEAPLALERAASK